MKTKSKLKILISALKTKPGRMIAKAAAKSVVKKYVKDVKKKS
jgi:hypothetical protein